MKKQDWDIVASRVNGRGKNGIAVFIKLRRKLNLPVAFLIGQCGSEILLIGKRQ